MARRTSRIFFLAALIAILPLTAKVESAAAASVKVGYLNCHEQGGSGFIFGATHLLRCTYSPVEGKATYYTGHITRYGVNVGYLPSAVMLWAVLAPSMNVKSHALQGTYVGASAGVSAGVGAGVNVLVGGFHKAIDLEPLSVEGEKGLNLAAGVAEMKLEPMAASLSRSANS
jgi:hypothetical protein